MQESELNNKIRREIIRLREQKSGNNIKDFARFLNIPYTSYKACEDGVHKKIRLDILVALREKMGIDINELLTGKETVSQKNMKLVEELTALKEEDSRDIDKLIAWLGKDDKEKKKAARNVLDLLFGER